MRIVILGQGGREQALAQAVLKSANIEKLWVIPGNAGMELLGFECVSLKESEIVSFCREEKVNLVIPGNEKVILSNIKAELAQHHISCFSPDPAVARLESSKAFCKEVLKESGLRTALFELISNHQQGLDILNKHDFKNPLVLKADGLAQGKGVWVCSDLSMALKSFELLSTSFGFPILAEQCLVGPELSAFAICDGENFSVLGTAVDYKRIEANPFSANTGGMGAYSPCHFINEADHKEIHFIFSETLKVLNKKGLPYQGFLFAGLMKTTDGLAVIEYNVRMGDPETQALLPRLETDFVEMISQALSHKEIAKCQFKPETTVHVVATSEGYPGASMSLGHEIRIDEALQVYFSGVKIENSSLKNSGGRVLGVTAFGHDISEARAKAYSQIEKVSFEGMYYRKDIGL